MDISFFSLFGFMSKHLSLFVGVFFVLLAAALLPARARAYVLTAGFAVIAYKVAETVLAKKRLQQADKEREVKRKELAVLKAESELVKKRLSDLEPIHNDIKYRQQELDEQQKTSLESGTSLKSELDQLMKEKMEIELEDKRLLAESNTYEQALRDFEEAERSYNDLEKVDRVDSGQHDGPTGMELNR